MIGIVWYSIAFYFAIVYILYSVFYEYCYGLLSTISHSGQWHYCHKIPFLLASSLFYYYLCKGKLCPTNIYISSWSRKVGRAFRIWLYRSMLLRPSKARACLTKTGYSCIWLCRSILLWFWNSDRCTLSTMSAQYRTVFVVLQVWMWNYLPFYMQAWSCFLLYYTIL